MSDIKNREQIMKELALSANLSRSERRVANYIYNNPDEVIRLSVAGLAEASGTSEATVIRMARHIGLDGYQDLKITLAQSLVTPLQAIHEDITDQDSSSDIADKIFQSSVHALTFTREVMNISDLERAARMIRDAASVMVIGIGSSLPAVLDLQHKLMRLGIRAWTSADPHFETTAATSLGEKDLLIAISHSGSSRDIVDCAQIAKNKGCPIISFTSLGISPLSKISDLTLHTASNETKYRIVSLSSRIALMAIFDCLYTLISTSEKRVAVDHFHEVEDALKSKKY